MAADSANLVVAPREIILRTRDRRRVTAARASRNRLLVTLLLIGPGILTMVGENDGPSMLSYVATGATYGLGFFVPFIVLTFAMAYVVQEATVRIGIATRRGHAQLIFDQFGRWWGTFALIDLAVGNVLTLVGEFAAICSGALFLGISRPIAVTCALGIVLAAFAGRQYLTWERTAVLFAAFNLVFIPVALMAHPHAEVFLRSFVTWAIPGGVTPLFWTLVLATTGATVTPWMIFFQQSAVIDKGLTQADLTHARLDTATGALLAAFVALATLAIGSVLFAHHAGAASLQSSADFAGALIPFLGKHASTLFALGMIEAGLTACITISTSTAYATGEALRGPASLNRNFREGASFYIVGLASLVIAAVVVLIPNVPLLTLALLANVSATIFMAPALIFVFLLARNRSIMGGLVNRALANTACMLVICTIVALAAIYAVVLVVHV
ncbi:MAG: NRAMP family divalent metal transporter [Candidatus Baltobacteraceae bacterium]